MSDAALAAEEAAAAAPPRRRVRWLSLAAKTGISLLVAALLLIGGIGLLLDTDLGHRLILDRIAALAPESGLRVRIGRLEGSIWGETQLRDVRLYDPEGLFAEAPEIDLEWQPFAWFAGRVLVHRAASDLVILHRLPQLDEDAPRRPLIPGYDVHIGRLEIAQLRIDEAVAGTRRIARVEGEGDFRRGRALVDLEATMKGGGDRLALLVDAAPDEDRFDLDVLLDAPAGGVFGKMIGTEEPLRLEVKGDGSWRQWAGAGRIDLSGRRAGELRLTAASGRYGATGWLAPAPLLTGRLASLAAPRMMVRAEGQYEDGVLDGGFSARSEALRLLVRGAADLGENRYRDVRIAGEVLRPIPLLSGLSGTGVRGAALLDGDFDDASIAYRLGAARLDAGSAALEDVQASGSGRLVRGRLAVPVAASVRRVAGVSEGADAILSNLRITGSLRASEDRLEGENLTLAADRLRARFGLDADLATGRYALAGAAAMEAYPLEDVGLIDVRADLRGGSGQGGFSYSGTASGEVTRLDNAALEWVTEGLPRIETEIAGGPDGAIRLPGFRFASPALQLSGDGARRADGRFSLDAVGRHRDYGPVALRLDGPRARLRLARPSPLFSDVALDVDPLAQGFGYAARGGSALGPFAARGTVALARGRPAAVRLASLDLSGARGSGLLRAGSGGVSGRIDLGGSLNGPLIFSPSDGGQRIETELVAVDARLGQAPIGSGRIEGFVEIGRGGGAPLNGRIRFNGAADRLWSMTGLERVALSGPLAIAAELGGSVREPDLRGSLQLDNGRLTSAATGTVINGLDSRGTFDRSRLVLERFAGRVEGGGRISGSGTIGLAGDGIDLRVEADEAQLLALPNMRAKVSGNVALRSAGAVGTIAGDLDIHEAHLRPGRSSSGGAGGGGSDSPWRLALRLSGERFHLARSGIDSRWRAELRVAGTLSAPAVYGDASLVEGRAEFLGRAFDLARGTMRFDGSTDPMIDIAAEAPAGGLLPAVRITGRASNPQFGLAGPAAPPPGEPARPTGDAAAPPPGPARARARLSARRR